MHGEMPPIAGDELPLPPGIEMLFGMLRLGELAARYDLVVLDGGAHDLLLRMLAIPDGLRWIIRLLLGLDRGPGRSSASVGRALLPTSFMPTEMIGNTQELRVKIERLRALVTAPGASSAQFVLRPDRPALEEARMAIPALHLHGLAVGAIVAGPLLPAPLAGSSFAAHEDALLSEASAIWPALPLLRFELTDGDPGLASLGALGDGLASGTTPPDSLLADVLERSGYMAALQQRLAPEELPDARAHLQELMTAAGEHTDLGEFLQEVALLTSADDSDDERDQVQLLTIHAAKGLEWPIVFVAGMEEGTLPHERSLVTPEGIEEERRLCYVALTRAGERLHLSWAAGRVRGQQLKRSRFLGEIEAYGRERMAR